MGAESEALVTATEAKTLAETAIAGQDRIERAIEAMRLENTTQHTEGRRSMTHMVRGLHRRLDRQDADREQLRTDVDGKFSEAAKAAQLDRRHLHGRINALTWSLLIAAVTCGLGLLSALLWLINNPVRLVLPPS